MLFLRLRHLSSSVSPLPPPPKLKNFPYRLRRAAVVAARSAVFDYLHSTRALPTSHADSIASLSPSSLLDFLSRLPPVPSSFPSASLASLLRRHLSFHPLHELPFFLESIGLPPNHSTPPPLMFLSDHPTLLPAVAALAHFGFPWPRLGRLYPSVLLSMPPAAIAARLAALEGRLAPYPRAALIAACLAFPSLVDGEVSAVDALVGDIGRALEGLGPDLGGRSNDIDVFLGVFRRMRIFYEAGSEFGSIGELVGRNQRVFLEIEEKRIDERLEFFRELGMAKEEMGRFLLKNAGVFYVEFSDVVISVPGYLHRVRFAEDEVDVAVKKYPYVVGRNQLRNLPGVLRAMGLEHMFLEKISGGGESLRCLLPDFVLEDTSYDVEVERGFLDGIGKVKGDKNAQYVDSKLQFLKSIGFGENEAVTRFLTVLHSNKDMLQERFNYLLERGVEYKMLCRIVSVFPKVLNQGKEMLNDKLNYLTEELGYSLEYLDCFPAFLCFNLENRIKPRYMMLQWLQEHGLLKRQLAPATVLANSEKRFISNLYSVHPAAPKQWLECFSSRTHMEYYRKNIFRQHPETCS